MSKLQYQYIWNKKNALFGPEEKKLQYSRLANMNAGRIRNNDKETRKPDDPWYYDQIVKMLDNKELQEQKQKYQEKLVPLQIDPNHIPKEYEEDVAVYYAMTRESLNRYNEQSRFSDFLTNEEQAGTLQTLNDEIEAVPEEPDCEAHVKRDQNLARWGSLNTQYLMDLREKESKEAERKALEEQEKQRQAEARQQQKQEEQDRSPEAMAWRDYQEDMTYQVGSIIAKNGIAFGYAYMEQADRIANQPKAQRDRDRAKIQNFLNGPKSEEMDATFYEELKNEKLPLYDYADAVNREGKLPEKYRLTVQPQQGLTSGYRRQARQPKDQITAQFVSPYRRGKKQMERAQWEGKGFWGQEKAKTVGTVLAMKENFQSLGKLYHEAHPAHNDHLHNRLYRAVVGTYRQFKEGRQHVRAERYRNFWESIQPDPEYCIQYTQEELEALKRVTARQKQNNVQKMQARRERQEKRDRFFGGDYRVARKNDGLSRAEVDRRAERKKLSVEMDKHPEKFPMMSQDKSTSIQQQAWQNLGAMSTKEFYNTIKYFPKKQLDELQDALAESRNGTLKKEDPRFAVASDSQKANLIQVEASERQNQITVLANNYSVKELDDKIAVQGQQMMTVDRGTKKGERTFARKQTQLELLQEAKSQNILNNTPDNKLVEQYAKKMMNLRDFEQSEQAQTAEGKDKIQKMKKDIIPIHVQIKRRGKNPQQEMTSYLNSQTKGKDKSTDKAPAKQQNIHH